MQLDSQNQLTQGKQHDKQQSVNKTITNMANQRNKRRQHPSPNNKNTKNKPTKLKPTGNKPPSKLQNDKAPPCHSRKKQINQLHRRPLFYRAFSFGTNGRKLWAIRGNNKRYEKPRGNTV
jgi:hypothetical protein